MEAAEATNRKHEVTLGAQEDKDHARLEIIGPNGSCEKCDPQSGWWYDLATNIRSITPRNTLKSKVDALNHARQAAREYGLTIVDIEFHDGN
jgi:hypothetical protein